ncbi:PREDICTED: F-box/kelch-repeat protein At3g23880-like [Erythranthe guttata]|uniref:F-box/kelch-repeat protein At3g23880-like n=1 Tax=Erythranthe guttata TaxID=4155 RepID=UPI00064D8F11|nr:PREDICTED: F-box/kelch-repeat protein At3g23880-like [Erythranthe guttata]|eukprot:XP_012838857.1 PREDICTED: F-box/kelch-repeat protein At3g23880-like [Erythranthe guttata]
MPNQDLFISLCNLIFPCRNLITHEQESASSSSSTTVSELPTSVILQIFFKLSIQDIIRCKCVCKSWHNLISEPYFNNTYQLNYPFTSIVRSDHKTVTNPLDHQSFYILEIGLNDEVTPTPFSPNLLDFSGDGIIGITGSCNGLLCLVKSPQLENESRGNYVHNRDSIYNNQTVCIVNPLLAGGCVLLPDVTRAENIRDVVYGFGSSKSANVYKVIRLVIKYVFVGVGHEIRVSGEIFTIGVDSKWRFFKDSSIPCYTFPCGVSLDGIVHWMGDDRRSGLIYAFDIAREKGNRIPIPQGLGDDAGNIVLAVWNGKLCLTDNSSEFQVDVWRMNRYGVADSWTRDVILKKRIPSDLRNFPLIPITTLMNGDLLMSRVYGQSLISFDPKRKKCRKYARFGYGGVQCIHGGEGCVGSGARVVGAVVKEVSPADMENKKEDVGEYGCRSTIASNMEDYSRSVTRMIVAGSGPVIRGILWGGGVTLDRLKWGGDGVV